MNDNHNVNVYIYSRSIHLNYATLYTIKHSEYHFVRYKASVLFMLSYCLMKILLIFELKKICHYLAH